MRLSHIKLSGFKSFAEYTTIDIKGTKVAIVGPNGCGKSNVIDAVRWVLGESSAKQLRGESMQDVIFNGSTKRRAVSRATVELVFDNTEKRLSGLWNTYDEIAIKRLISRSGDSIYYINNQVVRRRDITELFLGTGVGSKGYAVIEQGMISRIIESKPEDLRLYLEESAGISKYREKRKESLARLQDTRDNLLRLEDIRSELVKQIEVLSIQASEAKKYQELQTELKSTQLIMVLLKMDKARLSLFDIEEKILSSDKELLNLVTSIAKEEEQLSKNQEIQAIEEASLHQITMEFNNLRTQLARLDEQKRHRTDLIVRLSKDYNDTLVQIKEHEEQVEELNIELHEIEEQINLAVMNIEEQQFLKDDLSISFVSLETKYREISNTALNLSDRIVNENHTLDLLSNTKEHKKLQYTGLVNRQKKQEQELHGLDFNQGYFLLQEQIAALSIELEELTAVLKQNKTELAEYKQKYTQLSAKEAEVHKQQIEINTKIATLSGLVDNIVSATDTDKIIDYDKQEYIYQFMSVNAGYEIAVQAVLGNLLSAVVVDGVSRIKNTPDSMFTVWFENIENISINPGSLADFVEIKSSKASTVHLLLNDYIVAKDFAHASRLLSNIQPIQKIVTLDGHLLTKTHIIFNADVSNNHILEYKNQLEELEQIKNELDTNWELVSEELTIALAKFEEINEQIANNEDLFKQQEQLKHKLQLEFTSSEQIYLQTKSYHERISTELGVLQQDIVYLQDELSEIELKIEAQNDIINELLSNSTSVNLSKLESETAYSLAKSRLSEVDKQINGKIIDNQLLQQKNINLRKMIEDKLSQISLLVERNIKQEQDKLALEEESDLSIYDDVSIQINELAINIEEKTNILASIHEKSKILRDEISTLNQAKASIQERLNQSRLKEQEQLLFLHNQQEILDNLGFADDYDKDLMLQNNQYNLQELQTRLTVLQKEIEKLGLVNLKAIEDLEQITSKHSSLLEQVLDLTDGISKLEDAINQIDKESRILLDATYTSVCQSFSVYFKTLFGGGTASLELTDSDILNSGIQIFVQPPGKKNSSIHLLSGGEKALTAVSLIFALFNLNPAPFCLLDEVDAPLDDANTARFCNLVDELSKNTQFVYISHNRLTMEMADQLVGVTMQEKGVSTTVNVSLVDAVANAS